MASEKMIFPMISLWELKTTGRCKFGPQGHGWQDLCRRLLNIATYEIYVCKL